MYNLSVPGKGGKKKDMEHPSKRAKNFEKNLREYKVNQNYYRIPENDDLGESKSFLINLRSLTGL